MGTRGPKSQDELTIPKPETLVSARLDACYRDEESEVWKAIAESLRADWVNPGNAPVLAA